MAFPLTGDVTYLSGRVRDKAGQADGHAIVQVELEMKNQNGIVIGKGAAEVRLADPGK